MYGSWRIRVSARTFEEGGDLGADFVGEAERHRAKLVEALHLTAVLVEVRLGRAGRVID